MKLNTWLGLSRLYRLAVLRNFWYAMQRQCFARFQHKRRCQRRLWKWAKAVAEHEGHKLYETQTRET